MLATHGNFVTTMEGGQGVLETLQRHISETAVLVQQAE